MITPFLEGLIHEGKAAYKTFVAGGSDNHVLNVPDDKYIIITHLQYFPPANGTGFQVAEFFDFRIVQLSVSSEVAYNTYVFRGNIDIRSMMGNDFPVTGEPIDLDTYVIATGAVNFGFTLGSSMLPVTTGEGNAENFALQSPLGYGKVGQSNTVPFAKVNRVTGISNYHNAPAGKGSDIPPGVHSSNQLEFPVATDTVLPTPHTTFGMPIVNIEYVEIKGRRPIALQGQ